MTAIFKKDFKSFFGTMTGWIVTAFTLAVIGLYFSGINLASGVADFTYALNSSTFIFIVIVPVLTMRGMVEERRQKTDQLLLTAPITPLQIIMGKYLSLLAVYAIPLAISGCYIGILAFYGASLTVKGFIGLLLFFLMGAACLAIGLFISTLTDSLALSAIGTFGVLLCSYLIQSIAGLFSSTAFTSLIGLFIIGVALGLLVKFMTKSSTAGYIVFFAFGISGIAVYIIDSSLLEGLLGKIFTSLGLFDPFYNMATGMFDLSAVVYYISAALLFVFLSVQSIEKRRAG